MTEQIPEPAEYFEKVAADPQAYTRDELVAALRIGNGILAREVIKRYAADEKKVIKLNGLVNGVGDVLAQRWIEESEATLEK